MRSRVALGSPYLTLANQKLLQQTRGTHSQTITHPVGRDKSEAKRYALPRQCREHTHRP